MKLRIKLAAGALVAASALAGGAGVATATTSGGGILKALCEAGGGYWYQGKYASYCFYKDGSTMICGDWGCSKYPPVKQATPLTTSRG
ncbi:MAG: hypothetical protein ACRD2W_02500 [Acidimicrobiales bacterium]